MILHSTVKLNAGFKGKGIFRANGEGDFPNQPFIVIREATQQEYFQYCREAGASDLLIEKWKQQDLNSQHFYYKISID